jgi:DNA-binding NtrC family response regulator
MAKLLIVDDEDGYRQVLQTVFEAEKYNVITFPDGRAALDHLKKEHCDLIISDVRMPDVDGIELLRRARDTDPDIGVVLMTAFGTIEIAREAFRLGADDFIQKPFNNEELKTIVKRTIEKQTIIKENRAFRRAQRNMGNLAGIVGGSPKMLELFHMIEMVAREHATILITGDSGTGKELVARAIHDLSDRADKPFIPINCGALTETLLESELFGFIKGAFTGAGESRPGMFEAANNGTIFLDEIGDMSQAMQVKILRVLQEQRVRRIGARNETPVDTRVIAATNRDIAPMVESGEFRRDLYYRISVIPLHVPSLAERRDDIPLLVEYFIRKFSHRSGKTVTISDAGLETLSARPWHGNVRELEHSIERAVALTNDGGQISAEQCAEDSAAVHFRRIDLPSDGIHLPTVMNGLEYEYVNEALNRTGRNQTRAAGLLHIPVHSLRHLIEKHQIK